MISDQEWRDAFPALAALDAAAARTLRESGQRVSVPKDTVIFREGSPCQTYLLVLDGSVRVQKVAENGREIVLYRVEAGQTCVLTTVGLIAGHDYSAEAVAETDVVAIGVPQAAFARLMSESAVFREFVLRHYGTRILDLLMLIEEVAFGRIDARLAQFLSTRGADGTVAMTHQQIAAELGTAREVVSRQLKEFERTGLVRLARGSIQILRPDALADVMRKAPA